jgi:hypothetical protein
MHASAACSASYHTDILTLSYLQVPGTSHGRSRPRALSLAGISAADSAQVLHLETLFYNIG